MNLYLTKIEYYVLLTLSFTIPIVASVRFVGFSVTRLLVIVFILVCIFDCMYLKSKIVLNKKVAIFFMCYLVWMFISLMWTPDSNVKQGIATTSVEQGVIRLLFSVCCICFFCLLSSKIITYKESFKFYTALFYGGIVSSILLFVCGGDYYGEMGEVRYSLAQGVDPNYYAMNLLLSLAAAFYFSNKHGIERIIGILGCVCILFAIIITGSRGALMAVIVMISIKMIVEKRWSLLLCFAVSCACIFMYISETVPRFAFENFKEGAGRADIWLVLIEMIKDNFFMGVGVSGIRGSYDYYALQSEVGFLVGQQRDPHNAFLEIFAELGFIGFLLYLGSIFFALRSQYRVKKKFYTDYYIAVIGFFVASFFLSSILEEALWFLLGLLAAKSDVNMGERSYD